MKIKSWQEGLEVINYMLRDSKYKFAEKTLNGISDTIIKTEKMTEKQQKAIVNILHSVKD